MSSNNRGLFGSATTCHCGLPLSRTRSWTKDNPGRRFMACPDYDADTNRRGCRVFKWFDKGQTDWQRDVILGLMEDKKMLIADVEHIRVKMNEAKDYARKMQTEYLMLKMKRQKGRISIGFKCEVLVLIALIVVCVGVFVVNKIVN